MFNSHKKRRRFDAAAPRVRHPRSRRLAIEPMENRLLLSGNQATSDLDYSIWNLDSLQDNYAIISAGDRLDVTPTNTPAVASTPGTSLDVGWVAVPGVTLGASDARALSYQHLRAAYAQGIINSQQFATLDSNWGSSVSLNADSASAPILAIGIRPKDFVTTIGIVTDSLDHNGFFATDDTPSLPLRPGNFNLNLGNTLVEWRSLFDADRGGAVTVINSTDSSSGLDANVATHPIPRTTLILDPLQSGESLSLSTPLTGGGTLPTPVDTVTKVFAPIERDLLTESLWNETLTAAPIVDFAPLDIITTVTIPGPGTLTWQTVHSALEKTATVDAENDKVVELKSDELSASDTLVQQVAPIPTTGHLAVRPVPTRQTKSDDDLSDAIDSLLSEDTILLGQNGDSDTNQVAEATTKDAKAQQLAEGGMISVEQIVGTMSSDSITLASAGVQVAAANQTTDLVGELSRVAVMELIEGEPEPAAPAATDHVVLLADGASPNRVMLDAARLISEQANQAVAAVSPVNPAYLASFASAASHAFAAVVSSELSAQLSDAARNEAFSEWGDEDSDQFDSDQTALSADHESSGWLDAAPLVVVLACERTLAAKKKRRQRQRDGNPVTAK